MGKVALDVLVQKVSQGDQVGWGRKNVEHLLLAVCKCTSHGEVMSELGVQ